MYAQSANNETCTRKHYCIFVLRHVGKARFDTLVTLDTFVSTSSTRNLFGCVVYIKLYNVSYSLIYWSIH